MDGWMKKVLRREALVKQTPFVNPCPPLQPMLPYLPPELIDNIIEQIQIEDRETLAACSLTCRAWAPIAQSKYFRKLTFRLATPGFLRLIHASPHIALLPRWIWFSSSQWVGDGRSREENTYFAQIAPFLINVQNLVFLSVSLPSWSSQDTLRIIEAFPSLQELHIYHSTVGLDFLSLFFQSHSTLRTLFLGLGTVISSMDRHQELLPLTPLQHLRVSNVKNLSLLTSLLVDHENPLAQIKRLELVSRSESYGAAACTLLFGLRHTLHVLEVDSRFLQVDLHTCDGMNISTMSLILE